MKFSYNGVGFLIDSVLNESCLELQNQYRRLIFRLRKTHTVIKVVPNVKRNDVVNEGIQTKYIRYLSTKPNQPTSLIYKLKEDCVRGTRS